jgi:5-methylthioadenosine/S-adenosylhomocysteine deaminase
VDYRDWLSARQALRMGTINAARACNLQDEIGSLEAGKKADIVLLDRDRPEMVPIVNVANCLVYATDGRAVDTVLVNGRVVVEGGRVITVDERDVFQQVEAICPRIVARSGLRLERRWPVERG